MADHPYLAGNALVCGDNIDVLPKLPAESVDLVYLDPPFQSNHDYVAVFKDKGTVDAQLRDIWRWNVESETQYQRLTEGPLRNAIDAVRLVSGKTSPMAAYALFMGRRLVQLHRVLKPTGSIYLHCDYRAHWLLHILMDKIFGANSFRNEIVWCYTGPSNTTRWFPRKHDTILFYAKTGKNLFNRNAVRIEYVKRETGRTQGIFKAAATLSKSGKVVEDYWLEDRDSMTPVTRLHGERVGYPTQKPLALLERIILASSGRGALVLDPFCGCGTAADAAAKLGRRYLGIDVSAIAVRVMEQRLTSRDPNAPPVTYRMTWDEYEWEEFERRALMNAADAEDGQPGWAWAEDKVAGLLNAVSNSKKRGDGGADARYFTEAGETVPIQVKMHQGQIGRPDLDKLLGVQASWNNQKIKAPMSVMVTLYEPSEGLKVFAAQQGQVTLRGQRYPKMQVLSVWEMLERKVRPKLPPVDPRYFVGDTQTRVALA